MTRSNVEVTGKIFRKYSHKNYRHKLWRILSRLCAAVAAESILNPAGSTGKGLLLEHQQHIQVYSPNKKLWF